jgi:hypothetical protein
LPPAVMAASFYGTIVDAWQVPLAIDEGGAAPVALDAVAA